jgi:nucleotide-binding universal stress UspA family protein
VARTLVAVDAGPAAPAVARAGEALAVTLGAVVDVVHVAETASPPAAELARLVDAPVRVLRGDPVGRLLEEAADPDVAAVAVGAGQRGRQRPVGHVARAVLERASTPVLVVPRRQRRQLSTPPRHVLVPLDGAAATTAPVLPIVDRLAAGGSAVTVAHVFDAAHAPAFVDHPAHQLEAWGREFLARYARTDSELVLRRGVPWREVLACAQQVDAELIVLGWSQQLTPGRASVVREALERAGVPVLLVPIEHAAAARGGSLGTQLSP